MTIDLQQLEEIQAQCDRNQDYSALNSLIQVVFTNPDQLSKSFPQKLGGSIDGSIGVDKQHVRQAFALLLRHCPPQVVDALNRSIIQLLDLITRSKDIVDESYIPIFVILFQHDSLFETQFGDMILAKLLETIVVLPASVQDMLCEQLTCACGQEEDLTMDDSIAVHDGQEAYPSNQEIQQFQHILDGIQRFISMRLRNKPTPDTTPNRDHAVVSATKCLAAFYRLNEKRRFVKYEAFYNETLNEQLEIKEDFPQFKDRKGFSFCDYPFILNSATKADILKVESMFQMRHELQDAFFRALFQGVNSPYLVLEIRRDHIIHDALYQLETKSTQDLKKQLRIQFVGEEGIDEGGVQKEFFQLIVRELFDQKYGMFMFDDDSRLCWFKPDPTDDHLAISEYKLVGMLLGLAVYNSVILDVHFPLALYKKLMDVAVNLQDLRQLDPGLGRGLQQLLYFEGSVEGAYDRSFQIDKDVWGCINTFDLKENGAAVKLTNDNRQEFVQLYTDHVLNQSVEKQFSAFREGFNLVCVDSAIKIFRPEEIEQLICGSSDLDFDALEKATLYDGGWNKDTPIIRAFWEIVHEFTDEEKKKLLFFATGSDRVPIGGLSKLQFVIAKNGGDSDRLPTSHTCYNVLLLCEYNSKEKLRERLLTSIGNAEGFGMI
ncbi:hypothetical protein INT44_008679 [Umbelopsis vinacea]|uniref:HECT-type E3 ubiquitin transferase n=1 Tax=Umbelopsis vinacea TaxID=44442 RepID=A0A8H7PX34_9FUNG|nr:hypothetical protein INT44_008679 [Umbelopsis vinacea]